MTEEHAQRLIRESKARIQKYKDYETKALNHNQLRYVKLQKAKERVLYQAWLVQRTLDTPDLQQAVTDLIKLGWTAGLPDESVMP